MGWASGSEIMEGLITRAKLHIPNLGERQDFYVGTIQLLEGGDWDCQPACLGETRYGTQRCFSSTLGGGRAPSAVSVSRIMVLAESHGTTSPRLPACTSLQLGL